MPRPRTPSKLSYSLHNQLNSYALTASAAGVSLLALSQPAAAKIVYTPARAKIVPQHTIPLDLNHDGKNDFSFADTFSTTSVGFYRAGVLSILPQQANEIWGHTDGVGGHYASALQAGVKIGSGGAFSAGPRSLAYGGQDGTSVFCEGKWNDVNRRYLGLKFAIGGNIHFGWARLNVICNVGQSGRIDAVLTGYAYETIPDKPIIAGKTKGPDVITVEPASLGHLAQGASAISTWRAGENK